VVVASRANVASISRTLRMIISLDNESGFKRVNSQLAEPEVRASKIKD
jgi:hypothetical protein